MTVTSPASTLSWYAAQQNFFISSLKEFLRIPSVSSNPGNYPDVARAAQWCADHLKQIGMHSTEVFSTPLHPIVFSEYRSQNPAAPCVLFYGHFDVQPVDPLDLWTTPPFEADLRGENLYARGASDMKGQIAACFNAVESVIHAGDCPVHIKFILEGEEEIGSPSLKHFLSAHAELLQSDIVLNPDCSMVGPQHPTIVYALRGVAGFELSIKGAEHDLHSGSFGGVVHNPAQVLCDLVAGMHDQNGRITLPGFYQRVLEITPEEKAELARTGTDEAFYREKARVKQTWGEAGYEPFERTGSRPTLEINGMISGYTGPGIKTVIPSEASVKMTTRLVPEQLPDEIYAGFKAYLEAHVPPTVTWKLQFNGGSVGYLADRTAPEISAMTRAFESVWGVKPYFKREGGSIPVANDMKEILKVNTILTGFGLPDDSIHAPNEKLHLPTWDKGAQALIHFLYNLSKS